VLKPLIPQEHNKNASISANNNIHKMCPISSSKPALFNFSERYMV
jgi:hypothetical protein